MNEADRELIGEFREFFRELIQQVRADMSEMKSDIKRIDGSLQEAKVQMVRIETHKTSAPVVVNETVNTPRSSFKENITLIAAIVAIVAALSGLGSQWWQAENAKDQKGASMVSTFTVQENNA